MANAVYDQMENKQKMTNVVGESFENPYDRFIVDATEISGAYIIENALDEMSDLGVATTIFDGETPTIAEVSETTKTQSSFVYDIRKDELKRVANDTKSLDELRAKINANLDEQDKKECYRRFKKIISRNGTMKTTQKVVVADVTAYADIILAIKQDIADLKEPTDLYNEYTKTVTENGEQVQKTLKTFTNRPIVFIKQSLYDNLMVKYASGIYNLDKISLDADIIPVRDFYLDDGSAVSDKKLWLTCGQNYVKIYKDFESRANFEDLRNTRIGKAVDYIEYTSKLVPAKLHSLA